LPAITKGTRGQKKRKWEDADYEGPLKGKERRDVPITPLEISGKRENIRKGPLTQSRGGENGEKGKPLHAALVN